MKRLAAPIAAALCCALIGCAANPPARPAAQEDATRYDAWLFQQEGQDLQQKLESAQRCVDSARCLYKRFAHKPDMSGWTRDRIEAHERAQTAVQIYRLAEEDLLNAEKELIAVLNDPNASKLERRAALNTAKYCRRESYETLKNAAQALLKWDAPPLPAEKSGAPVGIAVYLEARRKLAQAEAEMDSVVLEIDSTIDEWAAAKDRVQRAKKTVKHAAARAGAYVWGWEPPADLEPSEYAGSDLERADREIERARREASKYRTRPEGVDIYASLRRYGWYAPRADWSAKRKAAHARLLRAAVEWELTAVKWRDALLNPNASQDEKQALKAKTDALRHIWEEAEASDPWRAQRIEWGVQEDIGCARTAVGEAARDIHILMNDLGDSWYRTYEAGYSAWFEAYGIDARWAYKERLASRLHGLAAAKVWLSTAQDENADENAKRTAQSESAVSNIAPRERNTFVETDYVPLLRSARRSD